jgi:hypothetical protein
MTPPTVVSPIPRVTLTKSDAAIALGVSVDSLERYVLPSLKVIRRGRLILIPVSEIRRWAADTAERTIE